MHCHNSALGSTSRLKNMVNVAMIERFLPSASERWACSEVAGEYLFQGAGYALVHNGVDSDKFRFSSSDRAAVRDRLGSRAMPPSLGLLGRAFLRKTPCVPSISSISCAPVRPIPRLLLFGQAEELPLAKEKADKLGLGESAVFIGTVDDIWRYYSAMDALLAPSFHEGYRLPSLKPRQMDCPSSALTRLPKRPI